MTIRKLAEDGYPLKRIRQISRSEDFYDYGLGFAIGKKRKTYYFYVEKLDKYLKEKSYE